jgi:hypothetical protein
MRSTRTVVAECSSQESQRLQRAKEVHHVVFDILPSLFLGTLREGNIDIDG